MTSKAEHQSYRSQGDLISRIRLRAAAAALAGAVVLVVAVIATPSAQAQTFTTLHSFDGANGANPGSVTLMQDRDGNLRGTTTAGGNSANCTNGCGTLFRMTTAGKLSPVFSFDSTDGSYPYAGLVLAPTAISMVSPRMAGRTTSGPYLSCRCRRPDYSP